MSTEKLIELYTLMKTFYNYSKITFTLFKLSLNAFMIAAVLETYALASVCDTGDGC